MNENSRKGSTNGLIHRAYLTEISFEINAKKTKMSCDSEMYKFR